MPLRALIAAATLALVAGCGGQQPSTPAEQGEAMLNAGEYDQAIAKLSEAIRVNPQDAQAYLHRGRAYQCRNSAGDLNAAIADLTKASELAPNDPEPLYSRAIAYRDRGKASGSEKDAQQALKDQVDARNLDPQFAADLKRIPDTRPPLVIDAPGLPPVSAAKSAQEEPTETADEAIRRIQARAAAAGRNEQLDPAHSDAPSRDGSRRFPSTVDEDPDRTDRSALDQGSRARSRKYDFSLRDRQRYRTSPPGDQTGMPPLDLTSEGTSDSAGQPTPGSVNIPGAPLTPGAGSAPRRSLGGTLPPVANSPFSTPAPYQSPSAGAANSTLRGSSPLGALPRSPFSSRPPRPTGRVSQQPTTTEQPQQRPSSIQRPRPTNHPPTIRHYDYNP